MQILQSKIILAKNINIDKNYINVIDYSESNMVSLVSSGAHLVAQKDDYQFLRNNGTIFVDIPYATCLQANYIAFQNKDYSNKWFFAWIDEIIFNSDKNAEIRYTIDQWSTWHDYWSQKPCFVKREHVNDDTIGLHTLDEDIDIGDLICDRTDYLQELTTASWYWIVVASNYDPVSGKKGHGVCFIDGMIQGNGLYAWLINKNDANSIKDTLKNLNNWLELVVQGGQPESVLAMYIVPGNAIKTTDIEQIEDPTNPGTYISTNRIIHTNLHGKSNDNESTKAIQRAFVGFTPKNNRLYCYPFSFIRISNNAGNYNDYRIEDFDTDAVDFNEVGVVSIGYSAKLRPKNYKGVEYNDDEGLSLAKYPTCSWSTDAYTNWLTQNSVNLQYEPIRNIISTGVQALSGNYIGAGLTIADSVVSDIGKHKQASMLPNTPKGNANIGDVSFVNGLYNFKRMHMRPKLENLQIADDYLTRFGYKCNRVKTANLTGRTYFNYVEIGSSESIGYGSLPSDAMETINNAFRKGVTIWHNHANIGNYNLDNSIVSN